MPWIVVKVDLFHTRHARFFRLCVALRSPHIINLETHIVIAIISTQPNDECRTVPLLDFEPC